MKYARTRFSIPESVLATTLDDEAVILHMDTRRYYKLNPTAAVIWAAVQGGEDGRGVVGTVCREFEVDEPTASREVDRVLGELADRQLVVPREAAAGGQGMGTDGPGEEDHGAP